MTSTHRYVLAFADRWRFPLLVAAGLLALPFYLRFFSWASGLGLSVVP